MKKEQQNIASGRPYYGFKSSVTFGNGRSILLQKYFLPEEMAFFNYDCISERVLHIKGTGVLSNFNIKYPKKFSHFKHTQKRDSKTNCKSPTTKWDFYSLNPDSLNQVNILMSDRGTPFTFRHQHGFGSHAFYFIKKNDFGKQRTAII